MPDPRILKSGDGWRVVEREGVMWAQVATSDSTWETAAHDLAGLASMYLNTLRPLSDLPRIAAALTALHEVLQERTTTQENR